MASWMNSAISEIIEKMDLDEAARVFREFVTVIKKLRTPGTGCPWDLEQNHLTLRPFLIEEAHEVLDAIDRGDDRGMREELGDLLLQVVLHSQLADDRGAFSITEVIQGIERKMVRRHPHVFGSTEVSGAADVIKNWEQIKAAEAAEKSIDSSPAAALERLPASMPALLRAQRLGEKAAKMGVGEKSLSELFAGIRVQLEELAVGAQASEQTPAQMAQTLGTMLFQLCQAARLVGIGAEDCLRGVNKQFVEEQRRLTQRNGD